MQNVHIFVFFVSRSDFPYEFPDEALPMYTQIQARARAQIKTEVYQQHTQKISRKVFGVSCVMCQSVIAVSVLRGSLGGSFVCLLLFVCC